LGGLLGGIANLQGAWGSTFGRNPDRDGDLIAGGIAPFSSLALDAIGLQYLMLGMALEDQSLADSAAESYTRAFDAAGRAGDEELLKLVRERQLGLQCKNGIGMILSTGQNPEDRFAKYQALRGTCEQPGLAAVLEALIEIERDRLPLGAGSREPGSEAGDLATVKANVARLLRTNRAEVGGERDEVEPTAQTAAESAANPVPHQPQPTAEQQQPEGESLFERTVAQQNARRKFFCDQTSDPGGCVSNDQFCLGTYSNNLGKYDEYVRAFHDQNIWYDVMRPFYVDPAEARKKIDKLLEGAFAEQVKR
jgi:hypothetical protein